MRNISYILCSCLIFGVSCAGNVALSPVKHAKPKDVISLPSTHVYFPFASDLILPEIEKEIEKNSEFMRTNPDVFVILEGHCDEVGPSEFNMELGDRRARAVKSSLVEHGVPPDRVIMVVSYGSTRPLNQGHRVEDLRQNRRVEFVIR